MITMKCINIYHRQTSTVYRSLWTGYHGLNAAVTAAPGTEHISRRIRDIALHGEFVELSELLNNVTSDSDEFCTYIDEMGNINVRAQKARRALNG